MSSAKKSFAPRDNADVSELSQKHGVSITTHPFLSSKRAHIMEKATEPPPSLHLLLTPPDLDPYPSPLTLCLQALVEEASQCHPTVVVPPRTH